LDQVGVRIRCQNELIAFRREEVSSSNPTVRRNDLGDQLRQEAIARYFRMHEDWADSSGCRKAGELRFSEHRKVELDKDKVAALAAKEVFRAEVADHAN
jgi:hypothetical protein